MSVPAVVAVTFFSPFCLFVFLFFLPPRLPLLSFLSGQTVGPVAESLSCCLFKISGEARGGNGETVRHTDGAPASIFLHIFFPHIFFFFGASPAAGHPAEKPLTTSKRHPPQRGGSRQIPHFKRAHQAPFSSPSTDPPLPCPPLSSHPLHQPPPPNQPAIKAAR